MSRYKIVDIENGDGSLGEENFSFDAIKGMVEDGSISREQEVQNLDTEEIVSADYILLFDLENNDSKPTDPSAKWSGGKAVFGIAMIFCAVVFLVMIVQKAKTGQEIRGRQVIIVGVLGLAGVKLFSDNIRAWKHRD